MTLLGYLVACAKTIRLWNTVVILPCLRRQAERACRDPASISISLKQSLHLPDIWLRKRACPRTSGALIGNTRKVVYDLYHCWELGIDQLTCDFRVEILDECVQAMEHLADLVLPVADRLD